MLASPFCTGFGRLDPGRLSRVDATGRLIGGDPANGAALTNADAINAGSVHVVAGFAQGPDTGATFIENLKYACDQAPIRTILNEPLNRHDAWGYFLKTTDQAQAIASEARHPNLRLMLDCYHAGRTEGDLISRLADLLPIIGHIQFASVPDRGAPDNGKVRHANVVRTVGALDWTKPLGTEFRPTGPVKQELGWMNQLSGTVIASDEAIRRDGG